MAAEVSHYMSTQAPARQLSLISDGELSEIIDQGMTRARAQDDYLCGNYTLETFAVREPRLLQAVIKLRGAGMGIKDVSRLLNIGDKTVMAIDQVYAGDITTCKSRVGKRWMEVAELAADAARERLLSGSLSKESLRDMVVAGATAMDKALLAAGEATEIRRVEFEAPGLADFQRQMAAMGLGSGTPAQKGAVDAEYTMAGDDAPGAQVDGGPLALADGGTDIQSAAFGAQVASVQRLPVHGVIPVQSEGQKGRFPGGLDGDEDADLDGDEDGFEEADGGRAAVGGRE